MQTLPEAIAAFLRPRRAELLLHAELQRLRLRHDGTWQVGRGNPVVAPARPRVGLGSLSLWVRGVSGSLGVALCCLGVPFCGLGVLGTPGCPRGLGDP